MITIGLLLFALVGVAGYAALRAAAERAKRLLVEHQIASLTAMLGEAQAARTALEQAVDALHREREALDRVPCTSCGQRFWRAFAQGIPQEGH